MKKIKTYLLVILVGILLLYMIPKKYEVCIHKVFFNEITIMDMKSKKSFFLMKGNIWIKHEAHYFQFFFEHNLASHLSDSHGKMRKSNNIRHFFAQDIEELLVRYSKKTITSPTKVYWVKAGAKGNGTSKDNPAGNITYILKTYNLTNAIINVLPGIYNHHVEDFPLKIEYPNVTLRAVNGPNETIISWPLNRILAFDFETDSTIVVYAENVTIEGFTIADGYDGIVILRTGSATIRGNVFKNNSCGITVFSSNNVIRNNMFLNNVNGITLTSSTSHTIIGENTFEGNIAGIIVGGSHNIITKNVMESGIVLYGLTEDVTSHVIDTGNLVNGKPLYYYKNQVNITVPKNAGQVILANCRECMISGLNISNTYVAIELIYCYGIIVESNLLIDNTHGVFALFSSGISIIGNKIENGTYGISLYSVNYTDIMINKIYQNQFGINLMGASNNTIIKNRIENNDIGIQLISTPPILGGLPPTPSNQNKIIRNNIQNNTIGIFIPRKYWFWGIPSERNLICENNFIGNKIHANDSWGGNFFNSTKIGNYWDDYTGFDKDGDGIGDIPYEIPGDGRSKDYKPAMKPFNIFGNKVEEETNLLPYTLTCICIGVFVIVGVWIIKKRRSKVS